MNKFEQVFEKLNPWIGKLTANKTLQGISASMMGLFPVTIIGSLCLLVFCIGGSIAPLGDFLTTSGIGALLLKANTLTIGTLAVYVVVLMGKILQRCTIQTMMELVLRLLRYWAF